MAGRRLTISALLCGDEQPQDGPQPHGSTSSHSTPFTPSVTVPSRSDVVSGDLRGGQDGGSSSVESHDNAFRTSIPSPHISRVSHNPVSLSLQPVHHRTQSSSLPSGDDPIAHHNLRGGHPGNEPVRLETPANASRSPLVSAVSPERDFASYHNFHSLPQTTPRPISTPRRSSDPRGSSFRSVEGSSYFARPRSGTSAHSDPLASAAAYTFPPPLPPQSPSYSAHQSSSTFFTSQSLPSPSRSPIFGRQPVRSPSQLLNSMSRTSPRGEDEQHSPSQHSPGPFSGPALASGSGSPLLVREEPLSARPSRVRSASHNQSGSPPSGKPHTPGAAALPNLLNAEPPRSPAIPFGSHASPGGLGALEALVQVATEERRRLSGELPTPLERRESARKASLSPVLNRHPPPLPQASLSPVLQRSPPLPSPRHDARVSSLGFISLGQPHPHDGEPPSKKRRRTDSTASGAAPAPPATAPSLPAPPTPLAAASVKPRSISQLLVTEPEPSNTRPVESIPELQLPPPSSDPPSAPTVIREAEEISPPAEEKAAVSHIRAEEKPIEAESNQAISNTREKTPSEEKQEEAVKVEEPSVALSVSSPEGVVLEPVPDTLPDTMPDASVDVPPVIKVQGPREQSEPDPHEWLLEHYATDSPAAAPVRHSPIPEGPPDTPELSAASPLPMLKEEGELLAESLPTEPLPAKDAKSKIVEAPSRTPTPLALLEAELDRSTPDERIITSSAVSPTSDADLAMELDLAADASEQPAAVKKDTSAKDELDDELLSLLDDTPRHSHSHSHPSTKASHAPSSSSRAEQLPVAKEAQVKKPSTTPAPRPLSVTPAPSDRVVMPPPIAPPGQASKSTANDQPAATKSEKAETPSASSSMKKKEPSAKPAQKTKQPAKPKAKAAATGKSTKAKATKDSAAGSSGRVTPSGSGTTAKGKKTAASTSSAASAAKRSVSAAVGQARSRSSSMMPAPPEPPSKPQPEEEEESEEEVDDKLYCICKTHYDEDKVMIACDRCDEWYHTQCLNMNDLEVDLIDQFVCPPCITANPHLSLKTTYKQRCFAGLKHPRPSSAAACHKPARGAFSKYCSDECGIAYMQRRINGWGGDQEVLWASVREVKPREGVVVKVHAVKDEPNGAIKPEQKTPGAGGFNQLVTETHEVQRPTKTQHERAIARLQAELEKIAPKREALKKDLEIVMWRQKLLELAAARAERVEECGWDQRLCLDDDEYAEYGAGILESYEEGHVQASGDQDAMQVDGGVEDGVWWCRGKRKCQRHAGWQKLRALEFEFEQELKEKAMSALTTQEREIRKQLEDVISLQARKANMPTIGVPLQPLNGRAQANGTVKSKSNGTGKKGKQKR